MRLNKTGVAVGLAVGVLAGGAGGVLAATGATSTSPTAPFSGGGPGPGYGGMYGMMRSGQMPVLAAAASYVGMNQTSPDNDNCRTARHSPRSSAAREVRVRTPGRDHRGGQDSPRRQQRTDRRPKGRDHRADRRPT